MSGDYKALVDSYKLDMKDLEPEEEPTGYTVVELKYDGWFTILRNKNGILQYITSGGDVRKEIVVGTSVPDFLAIGEWIYGTNWAKRPEQSEIFDNVMVHSLLQLESQSYIHANLFERKHTFRYEIMPKLQKKGYFNFASVTPFPFTDWPNLWRDKVIYGGYEGLVFKNSSWAYGTGKLSRMKQVVTMDYVIMDFEEGKGRLQGTLGAIVGGLFKDGILTKTCTVGGGFDDALRAKIWNNKTEYYLKVMEVSGKMYFEKTGAVRHPAFKHFRFDKLASECKWLDPNG